MKKIWQPSFEESDVEIEHTDSIFSGHFHAERLKLRHKMFTGGWSPWLEREQIKPSNSAAVVLYDPKVDTVVMVEQFRMGALGQQVSGPWLLEIVAGYIEEHEEPIQTVRREAFEEANCEIKKLYPVLSYYTTPGGLTEKTFIYCGLIDSDGIGGLHGSPDEHEDIKVHVLPALDVFKLLQEGMMTSSATVIGLQWLQINCAHLRTVGYL